MDYISFRGIKVLFWLIFGYLFIVIVISRFSKNILLNILIFLFIEISGKFLKCNWFFYLESVK